MFFTVFEHWTHGGGGFPKGLVHNVLMQFFTPGNSKRLLDQSQAGVYRGKRHIPRILGLFGPIRVPYPEELNYYFKPLENHSFVQ